LVRSPRPPLRGPQDDGRPAGTFRRAVVTGGELDLSDRRVRLVERRRQVSVHGRGFVTYDETWRVAVACEEFRDLAVRGPAQYGRAADLVAIEVQDRQDRSVTRRVEEVDTLPRRGQRPGFGFAVADHARDQHGRGVE